MFAILLASHAINTMGRQLFPLLVSDVRQEYVFSLSKSARVDDLHPRYGTGGPADGVSAHALQTEDNDIDRHRNLFDRDSVDLLRSGFPDMLFYRAAAGLDEAIQLTALLAAATGYFVRPLQIPSTSPTRWRDHWPTLTGMLLSAWKTWRAPMVTLGLLGFVAMAVIALTVRPWLTELSTELGSRRRVMLLNRNSLILTLMSAAGGMIIYCSGHVPDLSPRTPGAYSPGVAGTVMTGEAKP
jgi:hypothetical protein